MKLLLTSSVESPTEEEIERLVNQYHLPNRLSIKCFDDEEKCLERKVSDTKITTLTLLLFLGYPKASINLVAICK